MSALALNSNRMFEMTNGLLFLKDIQGVFFSQRPCWSTVHASGEGHADVWGLDAQGTKRRSLACAVVREPVDVCAFCHCQKPCRRLGSMLVLTIKGRKAFLAGIINDCRLATEEDGRRRIL